MSLVFLGTSRRSRLIILMASRRISKMLLRKARRGARGKAATKMVVKLNWTTGAERGQQRLYYSIIEERTVVIEERTGVIKERTVVIEGRGQ